MKKKKALDDQEVLKTLKKVEINIPLLTAIKQVPRYCKFLKELCTGMNKLKGNERVCMGETVSAVLRKTRTQVCSLYLAKLGMSILSRLCVT